MNVALGLRVLAHVEQHPEQFSMSVWGHREAGGAVTACVAGWTLLLAGHALPVWDGYRNQRYCRPDGSLVPLDQVAAEAVDALGLGVDWRLIEFYGVTAAPDEDTAVARFRTLLDNERLRRDIAGGEVVIQVAAAAPRGDGW